MPSMITLPLLVGFVPLLIYPWGLVVGVMMLSYLRAGDEPALLMAIVYCFFAGAVVYPLVYGFCAIAAIWKLKKQEAKLALKISLVPLAFLFMLAVLFLWFELDTSMLS